MVLVKNCVVVHLHFLRVLVSLEEHFAKRSIRLLLSLGFEELLVGLRCGAVEVLVLLQMRPLLAAVLSLGGLHLFLSLGQFPQLGDARSAGELVGL